MAVTVQGGAPTIAQQQQFQAAFNVPDATSVAVIKNIPVYSGPPGIYDSSGVELLGFDVGGAANLLLSARVLAQTLAAWMCSEMQH